MSKPVLAIIMMAFVSASSVGAQPPGPPMGYPEGPPAVTVDMLKKRADDLSLLIGLTPRQRPLLEAMLRASMPPTRTENSRPESPEARPPAPSVDRPFAEKLAQMDRMSSEHAKADQERIAELKALYADLNAAQRERFEAVMRLSHGGPGEIGRAHV